MIGGLKRNREQEVTGAEGSTVGTAEAVCPELTPG